MVLAQGDLVVIGIDFRDPGLQEKLGVVDIQYAVIFDDVSQRGAQIAASACQVA